MSFKLKEPIYTLSHGIEVIAEYAPTPNNAYWFLRIRPHRLFTGKIISNGIQIKRSRAIMTSILGRVLLKEECVHHINGDRGDDCPENLEVMLHRNHSRIHRIGKKNSKETRLKMSESIKAGIAEGRLSLPPKSKKGRKLSEETKAKISATMKRKIESGELANPIHYLRRIQ